MSTLRLRWLPAVVLLASQVLLGGGACAQGFPNGLITLLVPNAAGGFLDIAGRIIAKDITDKTGTSIVLDFRGGGAGTVGLLALKQAAPDGHTLLMGHSATHTINP